MWRNPSNNYEEYFREDRESESLQWRSQTPMESLNQPPHESERSEITSADRSVYPTRSSSELDRLTQTDRSSSSDSRANHSRRPIGPVGSVHPRPSDIDRPFHSWPDSESFANDAFYQPPPYSQYQHEEMENVWNHQYQHEPSNEDMGYEWSNECQYYPSNEEMSYMEEYGYQQESFNPNLYYHDSSVEHHQNQEDDVMSLMLQQILEGQERGENRIERAFNEISERLDQLALRYDSLKAKVEIQEASNNEDMVQGSGVWNVYPKEYNVVDEHQKDYTELQSLYEDDEESIQFQEDESDEDVQDAQFPPEEEIEEVPKDAEMIQEGEVVVFFPTCYEIVVEHKDDQIYTQQQSPTEEEVVETIQLHEDALDEDALALIVAVMNEETLRYNNASTYYETNKEEEEMVQIFELSQTELHQDEAVEPRVPGTPTPRLKHPQGLRKRLEWRIKHKWKIKPRNV